MAGMLLAEGMTPAMLGHQYHIFRGRLWGSVSQLLKSKLPRRKGAPSVGFVQKYIGVCYAPVSLILSVHLTSVR